MHTRDARDFEMDRLQSDLAQALAEATRLRSYNEGLAKTVAEMEAEVGRLRADLAETTESLRLTLDWQKLARQQIEWLRAICRTIAAGLRGQHATRMDMALLADTADPSRDEQSKETKP